MTFGGEHSTHRTFYLRRYPDHWTVENVNDPVAPLSDNDQFRLIEQALHAWPAETWIAVQVPWRLNPRIAPWKSVTMSLRGREGWRVERLYDTGAEVQPSDRQFELVVASVIIMPEHYDRSLNINEPMRVLTQSMRLLSETLDVLSAHTSTRGVAEAVVLR